MVGDYRVEFLEHDSVPWSAGLWPDRAGAWRRIKLGARALRSREFPVWARVYAVCTAVLCSDCDAVIDDWQREFNKDCRCGGRWEEVEVEMCVYSCDLRDIDSTT